MLETSLLKYNAWPATASAAVGVNEGTITKSNKYSCSGYYCPSSIHSAPNPLPIDGDDDDDDDDVMRSGSAWDSLLLVQLPSSAAGFFHGSADELCTGSADPPNVPVRRWAQCLADKGDLPQRAAHVRFQDSPQDCQLLVPNKFRDWSRMRPLQHFLIRNPRYEGGRNFEDTPEASRLEAVEVPQV